MNSERKNMLKKLQDAAGYQFLDIQLLDTALTHTSFVKGDGKGRAHNERLEFLGDAVLELIVSDYLFLHHPGWNEGAMTRARAATVRESSLDHIAREHLSLQDYLMLGHGEEHTGGREKPSIISDAFEALIGAIYLDGGFDAARGFVLRFAGDALTAGRESLKETDYKSTLQEYVQKLHLGKLTYVLKDAVGPDHQKEFTMEVLLDGACIGTGSGFSKQEAGQQAAQKALSTFKKGKQKQ